MNKKTIAQRVVEQYSTVNQIDSIATFASVFWSLKFGQHFTDQDLFTLHDVIFDPKNQIKAAHVEITVREQNLSAAPRQCHRKIGRRGGFSNTAFAGSY